MKAQEWRSRQHDQPSNRGRRTGEAKADGDKTRKAKRQERIGLWSSGNTDPELRTSPGAQILEVGQCSSFMMLRRNGTEGMTSDELATLPGRENR